MHIKKANFQALFWQQLQPFLELMAMTGILWMETFEV